MCREVLSNMGGSGYINSDWSHSLNRDLKNIRKQGLLESQNSRAWRKKLPQNIQAQKSLVSVPHHEFSNSHSEKEFTVSKKSQFVVGQS